MALLYEIDVFQSAPERERESVCVCEREREREESLARMSSNWCLPRCVCCHQHDGSVPTCEVAIFGKPKD